MPDPPVEINEPRVNGTTVLFSEGNPHALLDKKALPLTSLFTAHFPPPFRDPERLDNFILATSMITRRPVSLQSLSVWSGH